MNNVEIVTGFIERVLNEKKFEELDKFVSPHFETHSLHLNPRPVDTENPPKTFKEALMQNSAALSGYKRTIEDIFGGGERVVVSWTDSGIHTGNFMGIPGTEKPVSFSGISIYKVTDGKITDEWYVWDRQGFFEQVKS